MNPQDFRIGQGYDVHALVPGRPLIVGGVTIPHSHGLLGHSDADVLLHAITDAVLGAAALGDIGRHFPDTDPRFAGADSGVLLREAVARARSAGFVIVNIDSTIIAQAPRMAAYIAAMIERIAAATGLEPGRVNVKAKTNERLGFTGRREGIAAEAIALLVRTKRLTGGDQA
ncbi:MAG TPA: 2-C-methyl-D-erythritol 2,4-cyclodiphosphate synthase [Burkholderiaceae bacterium]|nr:2-C-methyl-D-erythritol 2,4-cyclodiphosphate synthase [Burkholderiaceae bacterium]